MLKRIMIKKTEIILLMLLFVFFSCGGSPSARSVNEGIRAGGAPAWIQSVDSVFNRDLYAAAAGFAPNRAMAEANALAALTAFFGQTVQVDRSAASSYQQAIINGVMDGWIDTAEMRTSVRTSAVMENLMGAEIREVWFDARDTYYAVAVMEKAKAIQIYNELLHANLNIINNLVSMTPNERNSLDGVIRYRFAAIVADINTPYSNIVRLLGGVPPSNIRNGDYYRLEAQNIIRTIPIGIRVTNDRNGRIFGAFAKIFTDLGFETTVNNSRYMLDVNLVLTEVDLPANPNVFSRIEISANLADTMLGVVLLPYNFNSREGHTSLANAENRAIAAAERSISEEFSVLFSNYLTRLHPRI